MNGNAILSIRGRTWFDSLAGGAPSIEIGLRTLLVADARVNGELARLVAVVPDPGNRFPRARQGEIGLEEGWGIAHHVRDAILADSSGQKRTIIAIVDVKSQAYGRLEALLGVHLSLAAAVNAYAEARMAGHPVVALMVGRAISGGPLAHAFQAHRLLALDDPGVVVQAMNLESAARVTRRSVADVEALGETIIPMSYDIRRFATLGMLHELIEGINADAPTLQDLSQVKQSIVNAIADIRKNPGDLTNHLDNDHARLARAASIEVRRRLAEQWNASEE